MYLMRPASAHDRAAYTELIRARAAWMVRTGKVGGEDLLEDGRAERIAAQAGNGHTPVWALITPEGELIGCTSLYDQTPEWGWTDAERSDPALFLATTFTHPDHRAAQPGTLIAWWALGHAAQTGRLWVRRGCGHLGLVRYYRDRQGFDLIHETERGGHPVYLLARKAEEIGHLPVATDLTGTCS
ncbi:GNAT family N-acetyltransferase [Streptomyces sp. NPDC051218]|uniref:GNAT family N-acetyltransferase n=1 Tax=Streptomyces sp. NPDC051218 TaxID=3365645 RepID=UPI0037AF800A